MAARSPSLRTVARRALGANGETALPSGSTVLVATSGGPDSTALLHVLAGLGDELGLRVVAHGVDHGLRAEAGAELDLAEATARALGVAFERTGVEVPAGGNLHARARQARYAALATAARRAGAAAIATAHHAEDRAETLLLRLLRGAGASGLAVLPPRAPLAAELGGEGPPLELLRPLLRARRADVEAHLARHGLPFAEDPTNRDRRHLRARVRAELLPLLEELGPGIVGHLEALADELVGLRADRGEPLALPRATQRALATLLRDPGASAEVWLPGGLVVRRAPGEPRARRPRRGESR